MQLYPDNIFEVTEFDKVRDLLEVECASSWAKSKAQNLKPSDNKNQIARYQEQSFEYFKLLVSGVPTPDIYTINLEATLNMLDTQNAALGVQQISQIRSNLVSYQEWFRWLADKELNYPELVRIIPHWEEIKDIRKSIDEVLDEHNHVKNSASQKLSDIRDLLATSRKQLSVVFDREIRKARKNKQLADTTESFINGRRVLAILSEYKRQILGTIHGESETHKTVYIEPQSTIPLNSEIENLESEERTEIHRILKLLTAQLSAYSLVIKSVNRSLCILDFIRAKARLGVKMDATKVKQSSHAIVHLHKAYHPLLKLQNEASGDETIPIDIDITQQHQVVVISGPNAGGKTVSLKTVMLQQIMYQSGLLLPASSDSELGVFKQIFTQIGDAQSIDLKLSTYSAQLENMKYLLKTAGPRTLFCIDELGSGSDPHLGGVFAEVILESLAESKAKGIVTTHYLNLKTLAERNPNMINAAMVFDEEELKPLYQFRLGKPGSSYTFSIAERVGIDKAIIDKAKDLVQEEHYQLETLLRETERRMQELKEREVELNKLEHRYEKGIDRYNKLADKEEFQREQKLLKLQNQIRKEEIESAKSTERKLKQLVHNWKRTEDKSSVLAEAEKLLFDQNIKKANRQIENKTDRKYREINQELEVGVLVKNIENAQVGTIESIENKKAQVRIGKLLFTMDLDKLVAVAPRESKKKKKKTK